MIVEVPDNTKSIQVLGPIAYAELDTGEMVPVSVRSSSWEKAFLFGMSSKIFERNIDMNATQCIERASLFLDEAKRSKLV